jgi:hypothetical protein
MAQEPKHTPGPWLNREGLVTGVESRERFKGGCSIDIFDASEWPAELHEEAQANARLIAALPEFLTALNKITGGFIDSSFVESNPPDWHSAFGQLQSIARDALAKAGA